MLHVQVAHMNHRQFLRLLTVHEMGTFRVRVVGGWDRFQVKPGFKACAG
ncbi:MAG: hypothetical protein JW836_06275 [Deltaproteobacteria bacterium]|nr:hypothetical protein [Deltaproteobacteria bacterium]